MFGIQRIVVGQSERALLLRDKTLDTILEPGVYWFFNWLGRVQVELFDLTEPRFEHPLTDAFLRDNVELMADQVTVFEVSDFQVGLVYRNERLHELLPPGERAVFWKGPIEIRVELLEISENFEIASTQARQLVRARGAELVRMARNAVYPVEVADRHVGLLLIDGELQRTLSPGLYAFWRFNRNIVVEQVDTRLQAMEVSGQEILTRDKVSLRINLAAQYQVTDPVKARQTLKDFGDFLYRELQFALRRTVAARTLDALLGNKDELDRVIFQAVVDKAAEFGIKVASVGVKDVILPGDMKLILNQVVEAQKVAESNVIKRREETAATRSLLNTAKLMDENPTLMRLKELETLEKITEKVDRLTVFGGLEGVLKDTVRINLKD